MPRESWQAALEREAREAHERSLADPRPWVVVFDELCQGLFSDGVAQSTSVAAVHVGMRIPAKPRSTDRDGVTYWELGGIERLCAGEAFMPGLMGAIRLSGLHGTYRKAGEKKEYRF